jgi:hypothetical protein
MSLVPLYPLEVHDCHVFGKSDLWGGHFFHRFGENYKV